MEDRALRVTVGGSRTVEEEGGGREECRKEGMIRINNWIRKVGLC